MSNEGCGRAFSVRGQIDAHLLPTCSEENLPSMCFSFSSPWLSLSCPFYDQVPNWELVQMALVAPGLLTLFIDELREFL